MTASRPAIAPTETTDSLRRAQAGDPSGFEELVREHQSMVFSLAYHFAGNATAAEDLAQDVFFELFQSLGQLESAAHLTFWLRRVTTHRCIDRLRRNHRHEQCVAAVPEHAAPDRSKDFLLEERVRQLVAELPDHAKAVMVLRYQEDLDPSEIAALLEMPINTVKSHLRRSVDVIRVRLGLGGRT